MSDLPVLTNVGSLLANWAGRITSSLSGIARQGGESFGDEDVAGQADWGLGGSSGSAFESMITAAAARHGLSEDLVKAVIKVESNFNARAVSSAGAKGLMQLMDGTASGLGVVNSFDPVQNIEGGVLYLRRMLDRFGTLPLALAAYNAGPAAVERYGGIPPYAETQRYVQQVLALSNTSGQGRKRLWEA
jgi:soluble lytic murein transglycosylase-like protein